MSTPNARYWHALNTIIPQNLWKLLKIQSFSNNPAEFFRLTENQLIQAGLDPSLSKQIIAGRARIKPEAEWEKLTNLGLEVISWGDDLYPARLAEIASPPPLLYIRGNPAVLSEPGLAVVGTRKISNYGKEAVEAIIPELANIGLNIISGMALGIDAAALENCIANGGTAIGVLASSLDDKSITPKSNFNLSRKIIQNGCLVSELPPGMVTYKANFPQRNRIVSGLAIGTLVIEAARGSGSLITANFALEQNREVFAVPGSIFSQNSGGTNSLIMRGAKCVTTAQDIIKEFGWDINIKPKQIALDNPLHQLILGYLGRSSLSAEDIIKQTRRGAGEIMAALTEMELSGVLKQPSPGLYAKIK